MTQQPHPPSKARLAGFLMVLTLTGSFTAFGFESGDAVRFTRAGENLRGVVKEVRSGGRFLLVETTVDGTQRQMMVMASKAQAVAPEGGSAATKRTWSDLSGKFSVEAVLVEQSATTVSLRKSDGRIVRVPVEKLSYEDQEYLATLDTEEANPFSGGSFGSPADTTATPSPASRGTSASPRPAGGLDFSNPAALTGGRNLVLAKMPPAKSLAKDPSPLDFSKYGNAAVSVAEVEFRETLGRPRFVSPDGSVLACVLRSDWSADTDFTKFFRISGPRGKVEPIGEYNGHSFSLSASDPSSGDALAILHGGHGDQATSIAVLSGIAAGQPSVRFHWRMFPGKKTKADFVRYREMPGQGIVLVGYAGTVSAVNYRSGNLLWTCKQGMFNEPAVSPGGRYAALIGEGQAAIVEVATGDQIGSIATGNLGSVSMGFSNDATQLAIAEGTKVRVFDVRSGDAVLEHEANVSLSRHGGHVLWADDGFLIFPTGPMLSLKRNLLVWNYQLPKDDLEYSDRLHQGLLPVAERGVVGLIRLPHEAAVEAADRKVENMAAIRPGDPITIEPRLSGGGVDSQQVRKWLGDAITRAGYVVKDGGKNRLVASITRGEEEERSYRSFGSFGTTEVNFRPYIAKVELKHNGDTLWQRSSRSNMPFFIRGEKSLQQVARESEKPPVRLFEKLELPESVLKKQYQLGFGSSRLGINGITDIGKD